MDSNILAAAVQGWLTTMVRDVLIAFGLTALTCWALAIHRAAKG
jgi:hypothetical protein